MMLTNEMPIPETLSACALDVLNTAGPVEKAQKSRHYVAAWRSGNFQDIGSAELPDRPAREEKPELRPPNEMPKRARAGTGKAKVALLHAIAHIELNAIDLAWDVLARQFDLGSYILPKEFYDDWCKVADDEAKHFLMLNERLNDFGASYGDLPAHDGLWSASEKTAHDFAARLAIVPMVLEARGLDVTPSMIAAMQSQGDYKTAEYLQIIHDDEITHVKAGTDWFKDWCAYHNYDVEEKWQELVKKYFGSKLKRPFNHPSRENAGMIRDWYEPLAEFEKK
ncbi:MAG: ferritin-like domain-containing protein [Alphaproteobacteria bacterium]